MGRASLRNMTSWTASRSSVGRARPGLRAVVRMGRVGVRAPARPRRPRAAGRGREIMPEPPGSVWPWGRRSGSAGRGRNRSASWGRCPAPCRRWPGSRGPRRAGPSPPSRRRPCCRSTWPPLIPPPARTVVQAAGKWSRPACGLILGVRPNSPIQTISVESSRPSLRRSSISVAQPGRAPR